MRRPLLRAEECARIHEAGSYILETVGVRVDDEAILAQCTRDCVRPHFAAWAWSDAANSSKSPMPAAIAAASLAA